MDGRRGLVRWLRRRSLLWVVKERWRLPLFGDYGRFVLMELMVRLLFFLDHVEMGK